MGAASDEWTYRPRTSAWWLVAVWVLLVAATVSEVVAQGTGAVPGAVPWAVAGAVVAYLVFWRPRVVVDDDGVLVVNPVRTVRVPWAALIDVRTQYAFTVVTPHGLVRAWAAPGPGRHELARVGHQDLAGLPRASFDGRGSVAASDLPSSPAGIVATVVRRRWSDLVERDAIPAGEADDTTTTTTWHLRAAAVAVAAAAIGLAVTAAR